MPMSPLSAPITATAHHQVQSAGGAKEPSTLSITTAMSHAAVPITTAGSAV